MFSLFLLQAIDEVESMKTFIFIGIVLLKTYIWKGHKLQSIKNGPPGKA